MTQIAEFVRALVRPVITVAFVGAMIAGAFLDTDAFDALREPGMLITGFWFGQRIAGNGNNGDPAA